VLLLAGVGLVFGRLFCGFLCPFGWFQDLLHRIPGRKFSLPRWTRFGKYLALLLLVFALPFLLGFEQSGYVTIGKTSPNKRDNNQLALGITVSNPSDKPVSGVDLEILYRDNETGVEEKVADKSFPDFTLAPGEEKNLPEFEIENRLFSASVLVRSPQTLIEQNPKYDLYYCKVCPLGTLTAHVPKYFSGNVDAEGGIYGKAGDNWLRLFVLAFFLLLMIFCSRAFCRTFCPMGAVYALCSRFALTRIEVDDEACVNCGLCDKVCPVALDVRKEAGGMECIACGACIGTCPKSAIKRKFGL
jgi:ferredoxin